MTIVTARHLGPADRGALVLAILAGVFVGLLPKSVTPAGAYQLARRQRAEGLGGQDVAVLRDSWSVAGALTACVCLPASIVAGVVAVQLGWGALGILVVAASCTAALTCSVPMARALAEGRMGRWSVGYAGAQVGSLVGVVGTILLLSDDLTPVAIGWSVGAVVGSLLCLDRHSLAALGGRLTAGTRRAQLRFSVRSTGATLLSTASGRADVVLLGILEGAHAVGIYSVAVGAAELVWFLGDSLATSQYGKVGRVDDASARRITWRLAGLSTLIAAAQAIPLALVAPFAMEFVFGADFEVSGDYLRVLLLGSIAGGLIYSVNNYYANQQGRPTFALGLAAVTLVVTAVLCLICIPVLGAMGAAIGSSAGYAAGAVVAAVVFWRSGRGTVPRGV
jgi:O-antigen/teichoic acid export membrane protein